jgi:radical SAM superfamily enzyme YgiQ (UPF0313 family)
MYSAKKFRIRKLEEVFNEIEIMAREAENIEEYRRVFLADGDALAMPTRRLIEICEKIHRELPHVRRISSYASPRNLNKKSPAELKELVAAGLKLIYLGIESGDDEVLRYAHKGETAKSTIAGLLKGRQAGLKSSVMILNGLGGLKFSRQHAIHSAQVLNLTQPEYASILVLMFPAGPDEFLKKYRGSYEAMTMLDLLHEIKIFLEHTELKETIFRSDHASNYLVLKGILGRDKEQFLQQLDLALKSPDLANLRQEWMRTL